MRPFGGYKGSNIALLVELLAAGLSGANWSLDAASFAEIGRAQIQQPVLFGYHGAYFGAN